jgi:hypothetical protein
MEDKIYKIELSDGTVLDNLKLNGNNFISQSELTEDTFAGKLSSVVITDSEGKVENHSNMALVQVIFYENAYWFILRDMTEAELTAIKNRADLEYIAMMANIELE